MATGSEQLHLRDALPIGTELGRYEIESVLGHGGFGMVYRARHLELDSTVAIKELLPLEIAARDGYAVRPRSADCVDAFEEARVRFLDEAKSLVQFRGHPGVVTCLEFFRANGTAYLVMEHVEGTTLSELLRRREAAGCPFDQADLLGLAEPILEALSGVHEAGLLHRDIKPSNILVRRRDDKPVLIDFGAAKQAAALHSKSFAPATEGYAAVEQVGEGNLGTWTDMYAIGAVLWRMVASGNPPWKPPNPTRVESRLSARVRGAPDPLPTARTLGSGRFSDSVLDAIDKCLELPERDRLQDCGQLLRQLRASEVDVKHPVSQSSDAESLRAALAPTGQRSYAVNWRRHPLLAVVVLSLLVAVLSGGVWFGLDRPLTVSNQADTSQAETASRPDSQSLLDRDSSQDVMIPPTSTRRTAEPSPRSAQRSDARDSPEMMADPGNADSQYRLARNYDRGDGVARDLSRALELYRSAADRGHADAQYNLGVMYSEGEGVRRDRNRAVTLYRLAAEQGHADAQFNLGALAYSRHDNGRHTSDTNTDFSQASKWLRSAAEQDLPDAQYWLSKLYDMDEASKAEREESNEWLRRAAEAGHADAQWAMYFLIGVDQGWPEAEGWLRRSAENGHSAAQMTLGRKYAQGDGVIQDHREAVKWFRRATKSKTPTAYSELCFAYSHGEGVPLDYVESAKWCLLAADHGMADSQMILARLYSEGTGVPRDYVQAIKWVTLSRRESPNPLKDQLYYALASLISHSEFEAGTQLANEWSRKDNPNSNPLDSLYEYPKQRPRR